MRKRREKKEEGGREEKQKEGKAIDREKELQRENMSKRVQAKKKFLRCSTSFYTHRWFYNSTV